MGEDATGTANRTRCGVSTRNSMPHHGSRNHQLVSQPLPIHIGHCTENFAVRILQLFRREARSGSSPIAFDLDLLAFSLPQDLASGNAPQKRCSDKFSCASAFPPDQTATEELRWRCAPRPLCDMSTWFRAPTRPVRPKPSPNSFRRHVRSLRRSHSRPADRQAR